MRWAVIALVMLTAAAVFTLPYADALAFIARAADLPGPAAAIGAWRSARVTATPSVLEIPTRHGLIEGRIYRPARRIRRAVVLVPGVHMDGIDEVRLVGMARDLAASGYAVLTVQRPTCGSSASRPGPPT